jgi:hypothetical protein
MHRYTVELRISGEHLDPDQITRTLGVTPTQTRRKGERKSETSTWPDNMWSFDARPQGQEDWSTLEDGLSSLLNTFGPIRDRVRSCSSGNNVVIWCGHFTSSFDGGPALSPELLRSIGDFGAELFLDTHCCPDESVHD